jgi:GT2 family glycosyltransferase
MNVGIVIPTFNRRESLLRCLSSLVNELDDGDRIIVVDAGSSDGTLQAVASRFPNVLVVAVTMDLWWAGLTNLGVRKALQSGMDHILCFNDDNVATPGFLQRLRLHRQTDALTILASVCCHLDAPWRVFFAGRRRGKWTDRFYYLDQDSDLQQLEPGLREVDLLHGMCTLIPRLAFESAGLFDADAFPHLYADDDFVLRAKQAGFHSLVVTDSVVLNDRSATGLNPYDRRLGLSDIFSLLTSRRSAFQLNKRCLFLWRHRRSVSIFAVTLMADYLRLVAVIALRWLLPEQWFASIGTQINRFRSSQ